MRLLLVRLPSGLWALVAAPEQRVMPPYIK